MAQHSGKQRLVGDTYGDKLSAYVKINKWWE